MALESLSGTRPIDLQSYYFRGISFSSLKEYWWKGNLNSESRSENILISSRAVGFSRQMFKIAQVVFPSAISTVAIPLTLLFTGLTSVFNGTTWIVPKTLEKLKSAEIELKLKSYVKSDETVLSDAREAVIIEQITVGHQMLRVLSGTAQIAFAILSICSESVAKVFHYSPILIGPAVTIALKTLLIGMGVISMIRAVNVITRFIKANAMISKFRTEFREQLARTPEDAMSFIQKEIDRLNEFGQFKLEEKDKVVFPELIELELTEKERKCLNQFKDLKGDEREQFYNENKNKTVIDRSLKKESAMGISYLTRRVGSDCAKKIFAKDFIMNKEFLMEIDKGIYKEMFRHKVSLIGGVLMLGSGAGSIIAAILTSGLSLMVVSLVAAVFSSGVESLFVSNEWKSASEKLSSYFYERSRKPNGLPSLVA